MFFAVIACSLTHSLFLHRTWSPRLCRWNWSGDDLVGAAKVGSAEDMRRIDEIVSALESKNGVRAGKIHIVPWLETAAGVVNAHEICKSSSRHCHPLTPPPSQ